MTIVGLLLLLVFGFFAIRHFRNGRAFWGILASLGSLLGAGSLWVDFQRATKTSDSPSAVAAEAAEPVIGDYKPPESSSRPAQ